MNLPEAVTAVSMPRSAARMADIEPFHVMQLIARAKELEARGRDIVNMVVGEPDFPIAPRVKQAAMRVLETGQLHYTPALGITALREAISGWYRTRYGVEVPASRIGVTTGSSGALLLVMGVLLDPGDQVLLADPGYPCNRHFVRAMDGEPLGVPVGPATGYQLSAELVERHWTPRTKAVLVCSPSNPTGTMIAPQALREIHELARARGAILISDEIYHGLTYGREAETALAFGDDLFVINSFSKYFGMTGFRLGWVVAPETFVLDVDKLVGNLFISAPDIAQQAALAAFHPETVALLDERRELYRAQRDFLLPALKDLGFDIPVVPEGAFYIYADCRRFTDDTYAFCWDVLEQAGVAIAPGLDFGDNDPRHHVRFSYPKPLSVLQEGVRRLRRYLEGEEVKR
ncbi:MAG TPA: pyridoxal phosphate-dependent aminotransferase [Burkholderiales bacterium]|nr:pyridoxal phosphate-dependent aminotransferase [Burkholderiales bacterium]